MKKVALLTAVAAMAAVFGVRAQTAVEVADQQFRPLSAASISNTRFEVPTRSGKSYGNAKSTVATPFFTDTFSFTSITSGRWTTTGNTGTDSWRIDTAGTSYLSTINSTTRRTGFLLYDAFGNGATKHPGVNPQYGYVTSPVISCTGHPNVGVQFQSYHRHLSDTTFVDVSTNNFSTFTRFPVYVNNTLGGNAETDNPTLVVINISNPAANNSNVRVRFTYAGGYSGVGTNGAGGTYGWEIDDFALVDLDPVDLGISKSGIVSLSGPNGISARGFSSTYSFTSIPLTLADTVYPVTFLSNYGNSTQANTVVTAMYYNNGSLVKSEVDTVSYSDINGVDSAAFFSMGYKPTNTGSYFIALSINPAGDAQASNNVDTIRFTVTDSLYTSYGTRLLYRYPLFTAGSSTEYKGARFTIGVGKTDTVTSVSVAFAPAPYTTIGQQVQAQLYKATGSGTNFSWSPVARTTTLTLAASDISTGGSGSPTNIVFTTLPMSIGKNISSLILNDGDYAVVVTTVNATSPVSILSNSSAFPHAPSYVGYQGQSDTSLNNANFNFGAGLNTGIRTGSVDVPLVRANFGSTRGLSVNSISGSSIGKVYPNPANTTLNVQVTQAIGATVSVSLSNIMGQTLQTQSLGNMGANTTKTASFNTASLAPGVYIYTVEANGVRLSNRVVIAH